MGASAIRKEARKRKFGHADTDGPKPPAQMKIGSERERSEDRQAGVNEVPALSHSSPDHTASGDESSQPRKKAKSSKKGDQRFILFIGNLPFSTTDQALQTHFSKVSPTAIRHRVDRETQKSKGYAFLEFGDRVQLQRCLHAYHHSVFQDGTPHGRRINVELTAGGGGTKSVRRRDMIIGKNERLEQQRKRKWESEQRVKFGQAEGAEAKPPAAGKVVNDDDDAADIHPSRRSRVPGGDGG